MTEKEKMIEEMAKVLHDRIINKTWRAKKVAEELYKIAVPEGAVVLTREAQERIEQRVSALEKRAEELNQVRKETAREIFAKIDEELGECTIVNEGGYGWNYQGYEATDLRKRLTKLARHFGVEVEE